MQILPLYIHIIKCIMNEWKSLFQEVALCWQVSATIYEMLRYSGQAKRLFDVFMKLVNLIYRDTHY